MPEDREKKAATKKRRQDRENKELARLRKELDDYVATHVAAKTNAGRAYEKEVQKLQDAIDEFYAGTLAGSVARSRKKKKDAASAKIPELETQIQGLRDAPGHLSREKKRQLDDLEEQLAKERKKARGVDKRHEASAAKKRSDATKAVVKLRRELRKAVRERRTEDVAKLEKELKKAEQKVAKLEANDRRKEELDGLDSRLLAVVARTTPGTALARDVETCCAALAAGRKLGRLDTSTEDEALTAAVVAVEKARRGGGSLRDIVEKALEAMKPSKEVTFGRKRRSSKEVSDSASRYNFNVTSSPRRRRRDAASRRRRLVRWPRRSATGSVSQADRGVEDAKAALDAVKQRRRADDDDVKKAEKDLVRATRRQDAVEACDERSTVRKECLQRLEAIRKTERGSPHLTRALRDATEALNVFGRQRRPVSEEETDALNNMMDVLANDKGAGVVKRRAEAIAAVVKASASQHLRGADRREAAARDVADLEAELDALPDRDDVDHVEEDRAKVESALEKAKARVAKLERNDELAKVAEEASRELRELKASGTSDAAYQKSLSDAEAVMAKFRDLMSGNFDSSEAKAKLRDMLEALRDSPGRDVAACTARDAAVTKAREALMTYDEIAKAAFEEGLAACARRGTTSAVDAYDLAKDGLTALPLDVDRNLAYALSRTAIAKARENVDALEPLLKDFGRLSPADRCALGGFIDEATEIQESLENRRHFLERLDVVEGALSRLDDARNALEEPRRCAAAFGRFKAAASTAGAALAIATALRYYAATRHRLRYNRLNEEEARLRHDLEGLEALDGSGSAYYEELAERRAAWEAAYAKTHAGRRAAIFQAELRGSAATRQLLTDDICDRARVVVDHGHVVSEQMREENKVVYIGATRAGNVDAEVRAVIKRPNFLIKNKNDRPISIEQCEVVIVGEVDDKVEAVLAEELLHGEIANNDEYAPTDYAWSARGKGTLTHVAGGSVVYAFGVTMRPDDKQRPSPCPRDGVRKFTPAFEAEIAAATAPLDSMPDERVDGDLDERMIKESKQRPVYHAYTRGPWSVHRWTKSRRAPFADEQRWLWPSADDARAWTQDKIDEKTSERGGYAIEDDDE